MRKAVTSAVTLMLAAAATVTVAPVAHATPSAAGASVAAAGPATVPSPPRFVHVTAFDGASATVAWISPVSTGGAAITDYTVQYKPTGASTWSDVADGVSADTTATVTGLSADGIYTFRVAAINAAGTGPFNVALDTLSAGEHLNCAVMADGTVKCWGINGWGGLGIGTTQEPQVPVTVSGITNAVTVAVGDDHACVVLTDSTVKCWGENNNGQVGDGTTTSRWLPVSVPGINNAVAISASFRATCALLSDGTAKCWGDNSSGALGDGTTVQRSSPVQVAGLSNIASIAMSSNDACALLVDGTVRCWGGNNWGQLGDGTTSASLTPVAVQGISDAVTVSVGNAHTCVLLSDASTRCWGWGGGGEMGNGTYKWTPYFTPVRPDGFTAALAVKASSHNTCWVLLDGSVRCSGESHYNEVGDNAYYTHLNPTPVQGVTTAAQVATATWSSCVLLADATIGCWGQGILGDGTYPDSSPLVKAAGITNAAIPIAAQPASVPGAVTAVRVSVASSSSLSVSWTAPTANGGRAITDYALSYSSDGGVTWTSFRDGVSATPSAEITGLTLGSTYLVRVAALNWVGQGAWTTSDSRFLVTEPWSPRTMTGAPASGTSVTLTWFAPERDGGQPVTDYTVQYRLAGTTAWSTFTHAVSTDTTATVTGLTQGASYDFQVAAVNVIGTSPYSNPDTVIPSTAPGAPTIVTAAPDSESSVALTWVPAANDGGRSVTDYAIAYSSDNGATWTAFNDEVSAQASAYVNGLTRGTSYLFTVAAINAVGTSVPSESAAAIPSRAAYPPPLLTATVASATSVSLTWHEPTDDGGRPVTDYVIQYRVAGAQDWVTFADGTSTTTSAMIAGLMQGSSYDFRVAAVTGFGLSTYADSVSAIPSTAPGAVTGVRAVATTVTTMSLSWTAPVSSGGQPVTDYVVTYSTDYGSTWTTYDDGVSSATSATLTGLSTGMAYQFEVAAVNPIGQGAGAQSSVTLMAVVPDAVTNVVATVASATSMTVTWSAPAFFGGTPMTGFVLAYSTDNGGGWQEVAVDPPASRTLYGLTNGATYLVKVAAVNSVGRGAWSSATQLLLATPPGAPTGVAASVASATSVAVSWTAPTVSGGAAVSDYTVQYRASGTASWSTFARATSTTPSATVTGLVQGTTYEFQVGAVNAAGTSAWSTAVTAVPSTAPGSVTNVALSPATTTSFTVTWTPPTITGGQSVTDYMVEYSANGGTSWSPFADGVSATPSATVTGLTTGATYLVHVAAINPVGQGTWAASPSKLMATVPGAPTGLAATVASATSVTAAWTAPAGSVGAVITDYTVQYRVAGAATWSTFAHAASTTTSATVTGLVQGSTYDFQVAAVNSVGTSAYSGAATAVPSTFPGAVTSVTPTAATTTSFTVTWTAPASNGGQAVTDYAIAYSSNGGTSWTGYTDGVSAATSATVTGLTTGSTYLVRVAAINPIGQGAWTNSASKLMATVTGAPTSLSAAVASATSVTLTWVAPTGAVGATVTDYTVQYRLSSAATWSTFAHTASTAVTSTVTGLVQGSTYNFQVAAVNSVGTSPYSGAATATPSTVPGAVSGVTSTVATATSLNVAWTAPASSGGQAVTDYAIAYSSDAGKTWTAFVDGVSSSVTATVTGLTTGTSYTVRVAAINPIGQGVWTSAPAKILAVVPGAPTGVTVTVATVTSLAVTWTAPAVTGGQAVTDYKLAYSSDAGVTWTAFADAVSTATSATVTGLTTGSTYMVEVAAVNANGQGAWASSGSVVLVTVPGAVSGVSTVVVSLTGATVMWTAPAVTGGTPLTNYAVAYSSDAGVTWTGFAHNASTSSQLTVVGLTAGSTYLFRVAAINSVGQGAWTSSASRLLATAPGSPTGLSARVASGTSVALSWAAPGVTGGASITDYSIQYRLAGAATWSTFAHTASTALSATVTGLVQGSRYEFQVAAVTSFGTGTYTQASGTLSTSGLAACAVLATGVINCWGWNSYGMLGDGTTVSRSSAAPVSGISTAVAVSLGSNSACALLASGEVDCWGANSNGQVGDGTRTNRGTPVPTGITNGVSVSVGAQHACAVLSTGGVSCWGLNWAGALGDGTTASKASPVSVVGISTAQSVSVGADSACAVLAGGAVRCWGSNSSGLGDGTSTYSTVPITVIGISAAVSVSVGATHTCAVLNTGALYCWGGNSNGQLGIGTSGTGADRSSPVVVTGITVSPTGVAAGTDSSCAVATSSALSCWGGNTYGQVGDGTTTNRATPTAIAGATSASAVSAGSNSACATFQIGTIRCWGDNSYGQLGDGTTTGSLTPVTVAGIANARTAVSAVPATVPGAATAVATSVTSDTSLSVTWTAPASGGQAITDYAVAYSSDNGTTWTAFDDGVSAAASAAVTGLTNGATYLVRVAAINSMGQGAWASAPSRLMVVGLTPTFAAPVQASSGFTVQVTNYSATYTWSVAVTAGSGTATISTSGLVTVTGVTAGPSTVAVTTARTNYPNVTATATGSATAAITSFTPSSGGRGTTVTLTGTNLWGATGVTIGGVAVTAFQVVSATSMILGVPTGAATGAIVVTTPWSTATSATSFTVSTTAAAPTLAATKALSVTSGGPGTAVLVTGTNLGSVSGATLAGVAAAFTRVSSTTLVAVVPRSAATGVWVFTSAGGSATSASFTYSATASAPTVTSAAQSVKSGLLVNLAGTNLGGLTSITVNGASVGYAVTSATGITFMIPAGATKGAATVVITTPGGSVTTTTVTVT